jgi:3-deoxy-D-manno-octulosonic-acid transferase
MLPLYNLLLPVLLSGARVLSFFNSKIKRGLAGRQTLFRELREHYSVTLGTPRILIHVASYGELEQAKPVISKLREQYPVSHIHLTFFSPSGYENVVGKYSNVDLITYSPTDRKKDVSEFLAIAKPDVALFTRYDVWPNMAAELHRRNIPSILFAATAAETSGRLLPLMRSLSREVFQSLTKILTISEEDRQRFEAMGVDSAKVVVAGDTRFDQVLARKAKLESSHEFDLLKLVRKEIESRGTLVHVVGSSWPSDESVYIPTVKKSIERGDNILTIIASHEPSETRVRELLSKFPGKAIKFSLLDKWDGEPVIVVDSIGKLFGLYYYADIATIGGGFGDGLHNILEPAVWGIPSVVGPNHTKSQEVARLIDRLGAFEIKSAKEFEFVFWRLVESEDLRESSGQAAARFVEEGRGATDKIISEITQILS